MLVTVSAFVVGIALVGGVGVNRVLAETTTLDGITATGLVDSSPESFWFGQVNRDGICRMISGCVSATGADPTWVFKVNVALTGSGVQTLDVNVKVVEQSVSTRAVYALSFASPLGTLDGTVDLALKPKGSSTVVTLMLRDMVSTGFAQESIPQFAQNLQPVLTSQLALLSRERVDAGTKVALTITPGTRAVARVKVSAASLTTKQPKARGQVRVLVGGKVVCAGTVRNSVGGCAFPAPKKGTLVRAVVTGTLSNGYPVWNSGTRKYGR